MDVYNGTVFGMWRNFAEFVALHYALSIRTDTEYWKANANRVYEPGMETLEPNNAIGFFRLQEDKMFNYRTPDIGGITWISVGMNYFILDKTTVKLREKYQKESLKVKMAPVFQLFEERKARWAEAAKNQPSLYQYLKTHIHNTTPKE
jgi:hypothetical protein